MKERECKICHKIKPISDFYKSTSRICKRCVCEEKSKLVAERNLKNNPDLPNEIWKDLPNYVGKYSISNLGRIRSLMLGAKKNCILTPTVHRQGYLRIKLYDKKTFLIHRLVAETFIPNNDNKQTVNHINGVKSDNRVQNLEWATISENIRHAFKTGLNNPNNRKQPIYTKSKKVTDEQVKEIRFLYPNHLSMKQLSELYEISVAQICRIVNNKTRNNI